MQLKTDMILPTNIEPANRGTAFGEMPNGIRSSWMEPTVASPKNGERWLTVVGSKDAESQCLGFVRRFAKGDAEIHLAKPSGSDSANELRRLAIALEVDWLCMVAERGMGLMSLFLRSDVERILRAAPCPVICIPEFPLATRE
ncbi:MAG TPA: universal stress protein, partial [Candidatus Sumerlaeota bacterium]|nr:universal stress protein [Candidatus Sumerlaeota bacterium]